MLLEARDHIDWLLDQLEVDFNRDQARLAPLLSDGQIVGVVAFELNYPGDAGLFAEKFQMAASMAGSVLGLALAKESHERWAERFAQADGEIQRAEDGGQKTEDTTVLRPPSSVLRDASSVICPPIEALAEMAAGVAHELNNPLSVIAGRAQLLAQAEGDGQKRHVLEVIEENAQEASSVVDDLMSYAEPPVPKMALTAVGQIIDESVQLAGQKAGVEQINAQVHISPEVKDVLVDSAQVVVAVANIIANSIESYADPMGPIKIVAEPEEGRLRLQIDDLGCGMDEATVRKAISPFFSAKPAGRRRGMGLAYASRLLRLNRGDLKIESQPGHGTTVTVALPYQ
jgi:signal transduction histidine kinase